MKRIALALVLATVLASLTSPASASAAELGPWSAVLGKAAQAFRIRQADDDGGSFDGGRHYGNANEDKKGRNVPRRQHGDPGDSGGRGGRVSDPSSGSGDSQKK